MGSPKGKILIVDTVFQNKLKVIKNYEFRWRKFKNIDPKNLEVTPKSLSSETKY